MIRSDCRRVRQVMVKKRSPIPPTGIVLVLAALVAGCGSSSSSQRSSTTIAAAAPAGAQTHARVTVAIRNYAYRPARIVVRPGTKIRFTNHDQQPHTATASHGHAFDTGTVVAGASATVTLTKSGIYTYFCQYHAFMHGTLVVK